MKLSKALVETEDLFRSASTLRLLAKGAALSAVFQRGSLRSAYVGHSYRNGQLLLPVKCL